MNSFFDDAKAIETEIIANRRMIHSRPELGFDLPNTRALVRTELESYGYEPRDLAGGVTCTVGSGSPVLLLRADMDALPQTEDSGEPFASKTPGVCHSCGHDGHVAMLLGAARILKQHEAGLKGTVKFMFQPAEEMLSGCRAMIEGGILEDPKVDAAMAMHANFGIQAKTCPEIGTFSYCRKEAAGSADEFHIHVHGQAAHGSIPYNGVSALNIAVQIASQLQQLVGLMVPSAENFVLALGVIESGSAANIIPGEAVIKGNIRSFSRDYRQKVKDKIVEMSQGIAKLWGGSAEVDFPLGVAPLINDPDLADEMAGYAAEACKKVVVLEPRPASEDFAEISELVPTFFGNIGLGDPEDGYECSNHNPKMRLDESGLAYGTAIFVTCAVKWLENHSRQ
jgi:amidohydrolase